MLNIHNKHERLPAPGTLRNREPEPASREDLFRVAKEVLLG